MRCHVHDVLSRAIMCDAIFERIELIFFDLPTTSSQIRRSTNGKSATPSTVHSATSSLFASGNNFVTLDSKIVYRGEKYANECRLIVALPLAPPDDN